MKRTTLRAAALAASLATTAAILTSCSSGDDPGAPPTETTAVAQAVLEPGEANPMIAQGVTISSGARVYKSSGLGPTAANTAAPQGTPESYIDSQFADGELPDGVTVTEAQGINDLKNIRAN
ncbi:MAG: Rid family hydrolase, partial [Rhodococcus sp. (in: high G+C Gram-positive bacteria)]